MNFIERKILGLLVKTKGILSKPVFAGKGLIFMLHRVLPENDRNRYSLNKDLAICPAKLEEFILFFKQKGYVFISLDTLDDWFTGKIEMKKKFICLTFDDGYKDNLLHALPLLKKHGVPATIYVTNCFPNGTAILWWYIFEDHVKIAHNLVIQSSKSIRTFTWETDEEAFALFGKISDEIKAIPETELRSVICKSFGLTEAQIQNQCNLLALTWDEIKLLANEPLITIGAHTLNHISSRQQEESLVFNEMLQSKLEIESYIEKEVLHFAYPFGGQFDVSKRDVKLAAKVGFKTSVLNQPGNIFRRNKNHRNFLARMPLGNRTDQERMNNYLTGIFHFANNQFSKSVKNLK